MIDNLSKATSTTKHNQMLLEMVVIMEEAIVNKGEYKVCIYPMNLFYHKERLMIMKMKIILP
jgi:hypothetical protein